MRVFNSLTKTKDLFVPRAASSGSLVTFYVCGPTVYDSAHLGHGRTYVLFDAMRRVLHRVLNKEVFYVMNITDVDDKIIAKCQQTGQTRRELTCKYETEFFQDMRSLGVQRPTVTPRATEYVPEMVAFIGKLMEGGFAYRAADGSVYMDSVRANEQIGYPGVLGKGHELSSEVAGSAAAAGKKHASDFALWKAVEDDDSDNAWDCVPFGGRGRPGWHLECSAMIHATLGQVGARDGRVDIHGGGIDLCFPHHANERCQSELHLGHTHGQQQPWAQFFCHTGHVTLKRDKMSKSTGNFITLRALMGQELSPRQLRLLFLSQRRYSASLEWTQGSVARAKALDQQLADFVGGSTSEPSRAFSPALDGELGEELARARQRVHDAMLDDFDFPKVFEVLQALCKMFTSSDGSCFAPQARQFVGSTLDTLGFGGADGVQPAYSAGAGGVGAAAAEDNSSAFIQQVVDFRAEVRMAAKSANHVGVLQACDKFRNACPGSIVIQDQKDGTSTWKKRVA